MDVAWLEMTHMHVLYNYYSKNPYTFRLPVTEFTLRFRACFGLPHASVFHTCNLQPIIYIDYRCMHTL